jgi:heme/copper-type cytochrome/quinol oxidase subunit 2
MGCPRFDRPRASRAVFGVSQGLNLLCMNMNPGSLFVRSGAGALVAAVFLIALTHGRAAWSSRAGDSSRADQSSENQTAARRTVEARGVDMKWQFFEVEDAATGVTGTVRPLGSELTLHRGEVVDFRITSTDYIYVLSLPDGQREIGVPEMCHRLTFAAERPGRFELLADPMCGLRLLHDEVQGVLQIAD